MKAHTHPHAGREALETRLHIRYVQLRDEIVAALRDSQDEGYSALAGLVHDRQDEAVADLLTDVRLAGMDRDLAELRDVEAALSRVRSGRYGLCVDCGAEVDPSRLEAYPTAKRCFSCQQRYERTHGAARVARL